MEGSPLSLQVAPGDRIGMCTLGLFTHPVLPWRDNQPRRSRALFRDPRPHQRTSVISGAPSPICSCIPCPIRIRGTCSPHRGDFTIAPTCSLAQKARIGTTRPRRKRSWRNGARIPSNMARSYYLCKFMARGLLSKVMACSKYFACAMPCILIP